MILLPSSLPYRNSKWWGEGEPSLPNSLPCEASIKACPLWTQQLTSLAKGRIISTVAPFLPDSLHFAVPKCVCGCWKERRSLGVWNLDGRGRSQGVGFPCSTTVCSDAVTNRHVCILVWSWPWSWSSLTSATLVFHIRTHIKSFQQLLAID